MVRTAEGILCERGQISRRSGFQSHTFPDLPSRTLRYPSVTLAYCSFLALFDLESGGSKRASLEKVNKQTNTPDILLLAEYRLCWCVYCEYGLCRIAWSDSRSPWHVPSRTFSTSGDICSFRSGPGLLTCVKAHVEECGCYPAFILNTLFYLTYFVLEWLSRILVAYETQCRRQRSRFSINLI